MLGKVLLVFGCIFSLSQESLALKCVTCDPCDPNNDNDGTVETCDEAAYQNLPDKGYHGCSYEVFGYTGKRRKRCIWLRNDPDDNSTPPNPRPLKCSLSVYDDDKYDCYCFTDECNRKKLERPTTTTTTQTSVNPDKGNNNNNKGGTGGSSSLYHMKGNMYNFASAFGLTLFVKNIFLNELL